MSRGKGMVLIEVLVALGVFSMAFVGLGKAMLGLVDAAVTIRKEGIVHRELMNRLEEARKSIISPGIFKEEDKEVGVLYQVEVKPLKIENDDGKNLSGLYELIVTASWKEGEQVRSAEAKTVIYQP